MNIKALTVRLVTFLAGLYFLLEFLIPKKVSRPDGSEFIFGRYHEQISNGFAAVAACAVALGVINLLLHHGKKILWRDKGYFFSAALLASLALTLFVLAQDWLGTVRTANQVSYLSMLQEYSTLIEKSEGVEREQKEALFKSTVLEKLAAQHVQSGPAFEKRKAIENGLVSPLIDFLAMRNLLQDYGQLYRAHQEESREGSMNAQLSTVLIDGLFTALGSAMFSLLGFYIAAAAYRAFRIKSFESGLLMVTATVVMLGQITFGPMLWEGFPLLRLWLLQVPSSAAARAIEIGASIAGLILAFRMWLSIESRSFRRRGE